MCLFILPQLFGENVVKFYSRTRNYLHTWETVWVGNVIQGMDLVYSQTKSPNPYEREV